MSKAVPNPAKTPRGPTPAPGRSARTKDEPQPSSPQDPSDKKNPNDPPRDPALLPIGDPAGAA